MTPEAKKQLEKDAMGYAMVEALMKTRGIYRNSEDTHAYMAGATAAWKMATELAVKAERERIYAELNRKTAMGHSEIQAILNPPTEESGT